MELDPMIAVLALLSSLWVLWGQPDRAWGVKAALILTVIGWAYFYRPDQIGRFVLGPWLILLLLPMWLQFLTVYCARQEYWRLARPLAKLLSLLHPWSGHQKFSHTVDCTSRLYNQETVSLNNLECPDLRRMTEVLVAQQTWDWESYEYLQWMRRLESRTDTSQLAGRLMATAYLGRWDHFTAVCRSIMRSPSSEPALAGLQLRMSALLGDLTLVHLVLRTSGSMISYHNREFWLAVAEMNCGQTSEARQRFTKLMAHSWPARRSIITNHIGQDPLTPPNEFHSRRIDSIVRPLREMLLRDEQYAVLSGTGVIPFITWILMGLLIGVFLFEIPGGSANPDNLIRLGALIVPRDGSDGEWTRMLTCGWLHFGPIHLMFNVTGLWILGMYVERAWGHWGVLVLFSITLTLSGVLIPVVAGWFTRMDVPTTFLGASGGVMGLLGGLWGHLLIGRCRAVTPRIREQFSATTGFIVLQVVSDQLIPGVSIASHLIGLIGGIMIGVIVGLRRQEFRGSGSDDFADLLPI